MEKQRPERRLQTSSIIIDNKNVDFVFLFPYYTIVGPGVSVFLDEKKIVFNPPSGSKEEILRFLLEKGGVGGRENFFVINKTGPPPPGGGGGFFGGVGGGGGGGGRAERIFLRNSW